MPNTLLTIAMITREASMILENNTVFLKFVTRSYDGQFAKTGAKIGTVLNVRLPIQSQYASGQGIVLQDAVETSVPIALNKQYQRAFEFTAADLTLSIDDFSERFIKPHVANLTNQIDGDGLALYKQVYNFVGTPGTVPNSLTSYLNARVALANSACPMDDALSVVVDPQMEATLVDNLKGLFNSTTEISQQYKSGTMGKSAGFKFSMDQNVGVQTIGAWTGSTPTVTTAPVNGATSIVTGGWATTTQVLNDGDIVYFAGVYQVNPQSKANVNKLQPFAVQGNVTSGGGGAATINFQPPMIVTGAQQNITALPAANAVITVYGGSGVITPQGLAFHKQAFCFATADLERAGMGDMDDRIENKGVSMRLVRVYDINTDRKPCRIDVLGGWAVIRPQLACRIAS